METYENNGICQYLTSKAKDFFLTDLSKSMLIIAEKKTQRPLCLVLDNRVKDLSMELSDEERIVIDIGKTICRKTKLPFFVVKYVDGEENEFDKRPIILGEYDWSSNDICFVEATIDGFVACLNKNGIHAEYELRSPQKEQNDKLSSDFHLWQREKLRVGIFTDIDMIRYDAENSEVQRIYELKRSKEPFEEWKPYYKEIFNYRILSYLCELLNVPFYVVFNCQKKLDDLQRRLVNYYYRVYKRSGEEFFDDVMELRIFQMCKPVGGTMNDLVPVEAEHITIDHFMENDIVAIIKDKYWNMHGQEDYLYSRKDRAISYCDPEKKYDDKYGGKKFYHIYEDCEWLSRNDKIKMLYRYEAYAEGYTLLCKKCSERLNRKAEED